MNGSRALLFSFENVALRLKGQGATCRPLPVGSWEERPLCFYIAFAFVLLYLVFICTHQPIRKSGA